jgi:hypothetical protein
MNTDSKMGGLIALGGNLEDPRNSKPTDWPAVGPSGAEGMASGTNQLVKQTTEQEGPMHTQDSGEHTPSVWGKADFSVSKNSGEGGMRSTAISIPCSVDFNSGQHKS